MFFSVSFCVLCPTGCFFLLEVFEQKCCVLFWLSEASVCSRLCSSFSELSGNGCHWPSAVHGLPHSSSLEPCHFLDPSVLVLNYFRMTSEWWRFAIKLLVLWICHNNGCVFFCSPQKNILIKNDVKMDKDGLTDLYIQHAIPLPQRDLPKSRWGKMMEKKRQQNESKSENKR